MTEELRNKVTTKKSWLLKNNDRHWNNIPNVLEGLLATQNVMALFIM
jgi:hypothetical protein